MAQSTKPRNKAFFLDPVAEIRHVSTISFNIFHALAESGPPSSAPKVEQVQSMEQIGGIKPRNKAFFWVQLLKSGTIRFNILNALAESRRPKVEQVQSMEQIGGTEHKA